MDIFKDFIELVTILLLFYVFDFLAMRYVGFYLPNQGLNQYHLMLEGTVLNTGLPGKPQEASFLD